MKVTKIAVLTSGGDSPGMNTALRAVVRTCAYNKIDCVGISRGYQGLINDDIRPLNTRSVRGIINRGGTFLYSARSNDFKTKEGRVRAYENLIKHKVDALIVIGGDGSFTGGLIFQNEFNFPVMGIPGTIDNDLYGTSHTLGYDTALNTVMEAIDKIRDTAISHDRLFFVEVINLFVSSMLISSKKLRFGSESLGSNLEVSTISSSSTCLLKKGKICCITDSLICGSEKAASGSDQGG